MSSTEREKAAIPENRWLDELSPGLFWDVRRDCIDAERNRRWLVERVLSRGRLEDLRLLTRYIGYPALREVAPRLRIEPRERNFLEWILKAHHA